MGVRFDGLLGRLRIKDVAAAVGATWGSITGTLTAQTDLNNALGTKVDKVTGKGLSTEDYTTTEKNKLSGIEASANNYTHPSTHSADILTDGTTNKAYTATEKTKLAGIAAGAEVNVNADWNASSGDAQILNKPTIPTIGGSNTQVQFNDNGSFGGSSRFTFDKSEGGGVEIYGGDTTNAEGSGGGNVTLASGSNTGAGAFGADISITGGYAEEGAMMGGDVIITAGGSDSDNVHGGSVSINGGETYGGNANGGSVELVAKAGQGSGVDGQIRIMSGNGTQTYYAVLDTGQVDGEDKTFSFPNVSGQFVVATCAVATDNITLDATHYVVFCNKATSMNITLPAASSNAGRVYHIKNNNIGGVTITPATSELIEGQDSIRLEHKYDSMTIACDGIGWYIIGGKWSSVSMF